MALSNLRGEIKASTILYDRGYSVGLLVPTPTEQTASVHRLSHNPTAPVIPS